MDPVSAALELPLARIGDDGTGRVADCIPELAAADPRHFGIAPAAMSGRVYAAGDAGVAALTALSRSTACIDPGRILPEDYSPRMRRLARSYS
jgi:glutaminase